MNICAATLLPAATPVPSWLQPLLILAIAFPLAALAVFVVLLRRKPKKKQDDAAESKAAKAIGDLKDGVQQLRSDLERTSSAVIARFESVRWLRSEDLAPLATSLASTGEELVRLRQVIEDFATRPDRKDPVALEHEALGHCWKQFRENKELSAAFDSAAQDNDWEPLLTDLPKLVPDELKPTFDAAVAPCREHLRFINKIKVVPKVVSGAIERRPTVGEELLRTRELIHLLTATQSSADNSNGFTFRFKSWVTDSFLPFADVYLQRYQQAQLANDPGNLQTGAHIVRRVLGMAAVEPIDVRLGETVFDSTRHIGRSTSNDPRFLDGVITGVIRNGFIEGGEQVIRQPEVIVNRTR